VGSNTRYLLVIKMELEEFREKCMKTAIRNDSCYNLLYASNALCGEAGELANYVKKVYRDTNGNIEPYRTEILKEIFDVLWYCVYLSDIIDEPLEDIIYRGFAKLDERKQDIRPGHGEA
jgi:NTP pyrophosphatase (non-canonical NTP hydrolase)